MLRLAFAILLTCALAPAHARDGMKDARDDVESARKLPSPPAPAPQTPIAVIPDPGLARMEVVYVQVEIFRDGRIKHKASMASDSGCRASLDLDRRQYSDRALAQMAALMGEDQTPIAVISECLKNPRAGECKWDPITRKLIGCWDKK